MPLSSINTGLQATPDLGGISESKTAYHIVQMYNAISILQQAIDTYTGNTPYAQSEWDASDPGKHNMIAASSKIYLTAGEDITAGLFVAINDGDGKAYMAQCGDGSAFPPSPVTPRTAIGIASTSVSAGAVAEIFTQGSLNIYAASTFTPGKYYYLGNSGHFSATAPTGTGSIIQIMGYALTDKEFYLWPDLNPPTVPATTP